MLDTYKPLSFAKHKSQPPTKDSHNPASIYKRPETVETFQTTFSRIHIRQEEFRVAMEPDSIISSYQKNQISPKQKSKTRLRKTSTTRR